MMGAVIRLTQRPLVLVLLPVGGFGVLILGVRWIPLHDTLQVTQLSHFLWSSVAYGGEFPSWMPYASLGRTTNVGFLSFLPPSIWLLTPLALFDHSWNAVRLVFVSQLLNEVVLVLGTLALGILLFRHRLTLLFVCFTVSGTVAWTSQLNFNFLIYYAIPLSLYLGIRGVQERSLWLLELAVWVLLVTGSVGDGLYPAIIQGALFLVVVGVVAVRERVRLSDFRGRIGRRELAGLAMIAVAVVVPVLYLIHAGMPAVTSPGRTASGSISYETFLHYERDPQLATLSGFFTGITLHHDLTTYGGALLLPLVVIGLVFGTARHQLPLVVATAGVFLFYLAEASFLAPLLYHVPGISLYRHIPYVAPHIKLFLIFLAGFGFDEVLDAARSTGDGARKRLRLFAALVLVVFVVYLVQGLGLPIERRRVVLGAVGLAVAAVCALRSMEVPRWGRRLGVALLIITLIDVYSHRSFVLHRLLLPVSEAQWDLFRLRPLVFAERRTQNPFDRTEFREYWPLLFGPIAPERVPLASWLQGAAPVGLPFRGTRLGMTYDYLEGFLGFDACAHLGLTHHALPWVLDVLAPYRSTAVLEQRMAPAVPPESFAWTTGCERPKLQFFATAPPATDAVSPPALAGLTSAAALVLGPARGGDPAPAVRPGALGPSPPYDVIAFSPNRLSLRLRRPLESGLWLYYADAWHPRWGARVDGRPATVLRANSAFKAIYLPPGATAFEFRYAGRVDLLLAALIWAESAALFGGLSIWMVRCGITLGAGAEESTQTVGG
jgi:hypothetical protein